MLQSARCSQTRNAFRGLFHERLANSITEYCTHAGICRFVSASRTLCEPGSNQCAGWSSSRFRMKIAGWWRKHRKFRLFVRMCSWMCQFWLISNPCILMPIVLPILNFMAKRKQWFKIFLETYSVLRWTPVDTLPTLLQAQGALKQLRMKGLAWRPLSLRMLFHRSSTHEKVISWAWVMSMIVAS